MIADRTAGGILQLKMDFIPTRPQGLPRECVLQDFDCLNPSGRPSIQPDISCGSEGRLASKQDTIDGHSQDDSGAHERDGMSGAEGFKNIPAGTGGRPDGRQSPPISSGFAGAAPGASRVGIGASDKTEAESAPDGIIGGILHAAGPQGTVRGIVALAAAMIGPNFNTPLDTVVHHTPVRSRDPGGYGVPDMVADDKGVAFPEGLVEGSGMLETPVFHREEGLTASQIMDHLVAKGAVLPLECQQGGKFPILLETVVKIFMEGVPLVVMPAMRLRGEREKIQPPIIARKSIHIFDPSLTLTQEIVAVEVSHAILEVRDAKAGI